MILIQLVFLIFSIFLASKYFGVIYIALVLLSLAVTIHIVSKKDNPMYKLAWVIPILTFPVFGGFLYLFFNKRNVSPKVNRAVKRLYEHAMQVIPKNEDLLEALRDISTDAAKQAYYLTRNAACPVWKNTDALFLSSGEQKWTQLLEELEKAETFIFLEYFIVSQGKMWESVLEVLKRKAAQGVEVRILYDDVGTVTTLPAHYDQLLKQYGIQVRVFNPLKPSLDIFMNYRDHRKIVIIDGNVGFTGGINLADEYVNLKTLHGHWKDTAVVLRGDAVWNLTMLFLQLWNADGDEFPDYERYRPTLYLPQARGFVQPFGDSPIDSELVGESAYMAMIHSAKEYIYITTPYLILDHEMSTALCLAAKSGIDVRIITPHIPDKWYVHEVTISNYGDLLEAGVKIYEYTPGFIHAKSVVVDGEFATIGTTNFDFRSFYLHFECGVWMYQSPCVLQARDDYLVTLRDCQQITIEQYNKAGFFRRALRAFLRVFAPLM